MADERDTAGFAEFATRRHGALYRYAYLLAGDRGLAEDLLQEALVKSRSTATPRTSEPSTGSTAGI